MPRFSIRNPYFIIVICLVLTGHWRDQSGADAGGSVPADQFAGSCGGHVLLRNAAGGYRDRHHRSAGALLHAGQRHRSHGIALAAGRQHHQGLFPARNQRRCRRDGVLEPCAGGSETPAAGNAAPRRAEVRCLQPAGLPGHAERPGAEPDRSFTISASSPFATRSRW